MAATLTHRAAVKIADKLNQYAPKEGLAYKKVILGTELFLINIFKAIAVFVIAAYLGVVFQALLVLLGFNILRRTAAGIHAETSIGCTLTSIMLAVLIPYFTWGMSVPRPAIAAIFALIFAAMWRYAPMDTKARPLIGAEKRKKLKRKSIITCLLLGAALTANPIAEISLMVTLGAMYSTILILPLTYKLFNRETENYEKFEFGQQNRQLCQ
jgi:accessory gene regulator B